MKLLTKTLTNKLLANGAASAAAIAIDGNTPHHKPVVKFFDPAGAGTWLISELDPENPDIAFGLCDLGFGEPELGSVCISELASIKRPYGLGIERDLHFSAQKTLVEYADEARTVGCIVA